MDDNKPAGVRDVNLVNAEEVYANELYVDQFNQNINITFDGLGSANVEEVKENFEKVASSFANVLYRTMDSEKREKEVDPLLQEYFNLTEENAQRIKGLREELNELFRKEAEANHKEKLEQYEDLKNQILQRYPSAIGEYDVDFSEAIDTDESEVYRERIRGAKVYFSSGDYGKVADLTDGLQLPLDVLRMRVFSVAKSRGLEVAIDDYVANLDKKEFFDELADLLKEEGNALELADKLRKKVQNVPELLARAWMIQGNVFRSKGKLEEYLQCYEFAMEEDDSLTLEYEGKKIRAIEYAALDVIAEKYLGGKTLGLFKRYWFDKNGIFIRDCSVTKFILKGAKLDEIPAELKYFGNLGLLDLSENNILKIEGLGNLVGLRNLGLDKNNISKIEGLDNLVKLERLYLGNNKISKIEGLDNLVKLEELRFDNNKISRIEGLDNLVNLEVLWLDYNNISWIEGLDNLANLWGFLILDGNKISSDDAGLKKLKRRGVKIF